MDSLFIIDASGYLYRSYFAIQQMTNRKGVSTNALFGFIRSLLKLQEEFKPTHCVAVFDGPDGSAMRKKIYAEYKAHRQETPSDLIDQINSAKIFCTLFGCAILCEPGVEADDTMASIALWAAKELQTKVFLCTADKDMCQLVDEQIKILKTHKDKRSGNENSLLGSEEVLRDFGVYPHQIVDYLALVGDTSDNIPGVKGIGSVGAAKLLQQYGTLEGIFENQAQLKGKMQELINNGKEVALLSRSLVLLHAEVPFKKDPEAFVLNPVDQSGLLSFCREMDFHSFIKELKLAENEPIKKPQDEQPCEYSAVESLEEAERILSQFIQENKPVSCFIYHSHGPVLDTKVLALALTNQTHKGWFFPFTAVYKEFLKEKLPLLNLIGHELKHHLHALANENILVKNIAFDTSLASYLLSSQLRQHSLEYLFLHYFNLPFEIKPLKVNFETSLFADTQLQMQCCQAADMIFRLKEIFDEELKKRELAALFYDLEMPLLKVLFEMERSGIFLEKSVLEQFAQEVNIQIKQLKDQIYALSGTIFDLNSPKQLREILFDRLAIKSTKKTDKGSLSTDASVLQQLSKEYPIAGKINEYRELEKLRSTYLEPLLLQVSAKTLRIHCTFNQAVAATGRLSCQDPNLQNIPIRTALGRRIREAFTSDSAEKVFLSADYSQLELRLLAHFSKDPTLIDGFLHGEDIHAYTAAVLAGIEVEQVSKELRRQAKAVNFGIVYGQQAFGLAQELQISVKEAAIFIENYFQRYTAVKAYLEQSRDFARKNGFAITATGRQRHIPDINSKNFQVRAAAERLATNTPLQGTAADIIKLAMLQVDKKIKELGLSAKILLQIHDELLFELPYQEKDIMVKIVKECMENVLPLSVPLIVDVSIGKNWKEC